MRWNDVFSLYLDGYSYVPFLSDLEKWQSNYCLELCFLIECQMRKAKICQQNGTHSVSLYFHDIQIYVFT